MAFPDWNDLSAFTAGMQTALRQFAAYIFGWASAQHKDDGSHSAITADSITLAAPPSQASGNWTGNLIPTADNTYAMGQFPTTAPITSLTWKDLYLGSHLYLGIGSSGGLNPVAVPAWVLTLSTTTVTWTPAQTGQHVIFANASGSTIVNIDPNSGLGNFLNVLGGITSTGKVSATNGYVEHSRSTPLGEWIDVAYASGNFTSSSGTWTVDSGDQILYRYTLIGKTMILAWEIDTSTVSGGQASLRIAIPGGFIAAKTTFVGGLVYSDAGAAFVQSGTMFTTASQAFIGMQPGALGAGTWSAATDTTSVRGVFTFEIQ